MLQLVLCDDNPNILEKFKAMLESILIKNNYDAEVNYATTKADELLYYVENNPVDALFLDINLKDTMTRIGSCSKD